MYKKKHAYIVSLHLCKIMTPILAGNVFRPSAIIILAENSKQARYKALVFHNNKRPEYACSIGHAQKLRLSLSPNSAMRKFSSSFYKHSIRAADRIWVHTGYGVVSLGFLMTQRVTQTKGFITRLMA